MPASDTSASVRPDLAVRGGSVTADDGRDVVLRARGLEKTFLTTQPPTPGLRGVDLDVNAGEYLAVMGASGSGTSTLLYALGGLDRPAAGSVMLDGQDLAQLDDAAASRLRLHRLGFVFQQGRFLEGLTIRDNVLLPALEAASSRSAAREAADRAEALLRRFGIAHVAGHAVTEVSGGQLQRASICRALAVRPAVLLADEPTGALNSAMTGDVMAALDAVHADGTTIVMVTHDPAVAARADRGVFLRDGLIVDEHRAGPAGPAGPAGREDVVGRRDGTGGSQDADGAGTAEGPARERDLRTWLAGHGF